MSAILGPSLTASHALANLSGAAPIAGILSGEGTAMLFKCMLGIAGSGVGDVSTLLSVEGSIDVDWEGLEWSVVDGLFALQGRWLGAAFDPLACQPHQGRLESSDVLPPASAGSESPRVGWLDVLDEREKYAHAGHRTADSRTGMANPHRP